MESERDLTAYCGLYCLDCIPSKRALFAAVDELRALAGELGLERYAELKSRSDEALAQYPVFAAVLEKIAGLRCPAPCRLGGGKTSCAVRGCAQGRGLEGCWECPDRAGCGLLAPLRESHRGAIDRNLDAITEHGPEGWSRYRGKHYPWSREPG